MKTALLVASALTTAIALSAVGTAQAGPAAVPEVENEKCFGISKAGKNDCQNASGSCAGTVSADNQKDAWIYVPAGTCEKIVGGMVM